MRKVITIASILLTASCAASAADAAPVQHRPQKTVQQVTVGRLTGQEQVSAAKGQNLVASAVAVANQRRIAAVIKQVESRIGKTWYVFSGDQPTGWDCSGLTRWAYAQLGVDIPHSATKQAGSGRKVTNPQQGDIVLFGYKGSKSYYHAALYVGNGLVVHAGFRRGTTTQLIPILSPAFKSSRITFIRVINTGS